MKTCVSRPVVLAIFGSVLVTIGTILCIFWPSLFEHIINQELPLSSTSRSFELWKDTLSIPMHLDFYFFNWTNPQEINTPGTKPNLVQVGPYSFIERREKVNITFNPENSTVSFLQRRHWYFDEKNSNGTLQDKITQLNVVAVTAAYKVRYWWYFAQSPVSIILSRLNGIDITKTVDELLFEGYSDSLIDIGRMFSEKDVPAFDKFGWFYKRNGSSGFDGHYNMATGQDNIENLGALKLWNYKNETQFYERPCNAVEGSAGEFWPPGRSKEDINLFSADVCRPLTYEYVRTVSIYGIEGYQYSIGDKTLSNSTKRCYPHEQRKYFNPSTTTEDYYFPEDYSTSPPFSDQEDSDEVNVGQCFCNGNCIPSGVFNVSSCRYGSPAFVSLPHFFKADPIYKDQVTGMDPNEEKHDFYITLEPKTGIPLDVAARLQINILLQPSENIALFNDVPKIFFPVFWFDQRVVVPENLAYPLSQLLLVRNIELYFDLALILFGLLILLYVGVRFFMRRKRRNITGTLSEKPIPASQRTEQVYLDTTIQNDDRFSRGDRQLYPKLSSDLNC